MVREIPSIHFSVAFLSAAANFLLLLTLETEVDPSGLHGPFVEECGFAKVTFAKALNELS